MLQRVLPALMGIVLLASSLATQANERDAEGQHYEPLALPALKGDRTRPLVAVLAANEGAETTDFIIPYGVLKESGAADVVGVSTHPGTVRLHPALSARLELTTAEFDIEQPTGADIVIVPAMHNPHDPEVIHWIQQQAQAGALIVGICDGVLSLARAGLLDGKNSTGHWYSLDKLRDDYPTTHWVQNQRYVADTAVVTTAGVTASLPVSLALVEAIAGRAEAERVAARLGVANFDAHHDTSIFGFTLSHKLTIAGNLVAVWNREDVTLPVDDGVDEIALALAADAWSRTFRSSAKATRDTRGVVRSKRGLLIEVDVNRANDETTFALPDQRPASALPRTLTRIAERYGERTAQIVATQLEYPR